MARTRSGSVVSENENVSRLSDFFPGLIARACDIPILVCLAIAKLVNSFYEDAQTYLNISSINRYYLMIFLGCDYVQSYSLISKLFKRDVSRFLN